MLCACLCVLWKRNPAPSLLRLAPLVITPPCRVLDYDMWRILQETMAVRGGRRLLGTEIGRARRVVPTCSRRKLRWVLCSVSLSRWLLVVCVDVLVAVCALNC